MQGKRPIALIVEDEPIQRLMAMDLAEEAGFKAVQAAGCSQAMAIMESTPGIRLVFTDIRMPIGMDGLKMAMAIRARWPVVGLILISAWPAPRSEDLPMHGIFIPKPYPEAVVISVMHRIVR